MAAYWLSGPRPGHATISDATQWHHVAHDVERVLADIDTNHGNCSVQCLGHGVLLVLTPLPSILLLAGQEHGRTIPLTDVSPVSILSGLQPIFVHRLISSTYASQPKGRIVPTVW